MQVNLDEVVRLLNDALALDPVAVTNLFSHLTACNGSLANHPTIQVLPIGGNLMLGVLALFNAAFAASGGVIAPTWMRLPGESRRLLSFQIVPIGTWVEQ